MQIVHSDVVVRVPPGETPRYEDRNPLTKIIDQIERIQLAAGREHYLADHLQYLFPIDHLELHGPQGHNADVLDPRHQDDKNDFQKQNVKDFLSADTTVARGWVAGDGWTVPFLRLSYRGGDTSRLARAAGGGLGDHVKLWLKVGATSTDSPIAVPYQPEAHRYEVELWGYTGPDLWNQLDDRGRAAMDRGELQVRPDLVRGDRGAFARDQLTDRRMVDVEPDCTMHPILPLKLEVAWTDPTETHWDSRNGANHRYTFSMVVRGWDNFLQVGTSKNPHGGVGFLEYRNLMSNYFHHAARPELGRELEPWNFDANGSKVHGGRRENFLAVEYLDLHVLKPNCGIGLHRHRDNQEIFLMMEGRGLMVVGDWCEMPDRDRCFEVRTLRAGHMALLKGGNLHALANLVDENSTLFMFGGYD